jgi:hypothetical protein
MLDLLIRRYRSSVPWLLVVTFAILIYTQNSRAPQQPCKPRAAKAPPHGALTRADTLSVRAHSRHCEQGPMKLAIYQGRWYHSEVFGTLIDHANECGHSLTIYYEDGHATSAVPLYIALYPDRFSVREPRHFLAEQHSYDAVIFTTPDDIPDEGLQKRNAHRFIYTVHLLEPAYAKDWHVLRLHMSTVVSWPFVVPVYDGGDAPPPAAGRTKEIMMLGTLWDGDNYDIKQVYRLAELLAPHGWTLVAYTRHWGTDAKPPPNMRLEMSKGTVEVRVVKGEGGARQMLRARARTRRGIAGLHTPPALTPPPLLTPAPPTPGFRVRQKGVLHYHLAVRQVLVHCGPPHGQPALCHVRGHASADVCRLCQRVRAARGQGVRGGRGRGGAGGAGGGRGGQGNGAGAPPGAGGHAVRLQGGGAGAEHAHTGLPAERRARQHAGSATGTAKSTD